MPERTESQMNSLRKKTYGTLSFLGIAGTAWLGYSTYKADSILVDALDKCQATVSAVDRMHCAWQDPDTIKRIMADPKFDIHPSTDNEDTPLLFDVTDVNVYQTDMALDAAVADLGDKRASDVTHVLIAGGIGTLLLNGIGSIPLVRRKEWDGNSGEFIYT
jgi:hypothetical protein